MATKDLYKMMQEAAQLQIAHAVKIAAGVQTGSPLPLDIRSQLCMENYYFAFAVFVLHKYGRSDDGRGNSFCRHCGFDDAAGFLCSRSDCIKSRELGFRKWLNNQMSLQYQDDHRDEVRAKREERRRKRIGMRSAASLAVGIKKMKEAINAR